MSPLPVDALSAVWRGGEKSYSWGSLWGALRHIGVFRGLRSRVFFWSEKFRALRTPVPLTYLYIGASDWRQL
jgi:hypothetical protein